MKPRVIVLCGSSKFVDIMAVCAWEIEKVEGAIVMGLHLIPRWYSENLPADHLAEHEGVSKKMDALHHEKIKFADEIFVVDFRGYIGSSTMNEISYARRTGKNVRYFSRDPIGELVMERIRAYWSEGNESLPRVEYGHHEQGKTRIPKRPFLKEKK